MQPQGCPLAAERDGHLDGGRDLRDDRHGEHRRKASRADNRRQELVLPSGHANLLPRLEAEDASHHLQHGVRVAHQTGRVCDPAVTPFLAAVRACRAPLAIQGTAGTRANRHSVVVVHVNGACWAVHQLPLRLREAAIWLVVNDIME